MFLSLLNVNVGENPDCPSPGRQWLASVYRVHQRLWMAFPGRDRRERDPFFLGPWTGPDGSTHKPKRHEAGFLFRIERDGCPRILVQSVQRPDWDYAFQNAPYLLVGTPAVRQFEAAPQRDQAYRFRLLANVVENRTFARPDGSMRTTRAGLTIARRRRTEAIIYPSRVPDPLPSDLAERQRALHAQWEPWRAWLERLGEKHGFRAIDDDLTPLHMAPVRTMVRRPRKDPPGFHDPKRFNAGLFEGTLMCTELNALRDAVIDGLGRAKGFGFGLLSLAPA